MGFISGEIGPGAFSEEKKWAGSSNTILHHSTIIAATIWREECERKENEWRISGETIMVDSLHILSFYVTSVLPIV